VLIDKYIDKCSRMFAIERVYVAYLRETLEDLPSICELKKLKNNVLCLHNIVSKIQIFLYIILCIES
jgi:hypothetical protein